MDGYKAPPKNAKDLQKRIEEYFESRLEPVRDKNGNPVLDGDGNPKRDTARPATLTGFALALGLESREALYEFKDGRMRRLIRQGILKIEEYAEERLFSKDGFSGIKLFLSVNFERWSNAKAEEPEDGEEVVLSDEIKKWAK